MDLIDKHKLVSQFAVDVYMSPQSVDELKIKYNMVPRNKSQNTLLIYNDDSVVAKILEEKNRDKVLEMCKNNPELCLSTKLDSVWKHKITSECRGKFRGTNIAKYNNIDSFNKDHKSNFKNFYHIFQLCKLIPSKQSELVEHVFAHATPSHGNDFNYVQIAGFIDSGKTLIIRKVPYLELAIPGGKPIIKPNMDWIVKHPIVKMNKLPREVELNYPDYTRISINGIIEHEFNKQGFREWWFEARGKGLYNLIIDYY